MTFTITRRLTITAACLSALILASAGIAFYLSMKHGIDAEAVERTCSDILVLDNAILGQLDNDILVEFAGERVEFAQLDIPFDHWAVVRGNGEIEEAKGIFEDKTVISPNSFTEIMQVLGNESFNFASLPLVSERRLTWDDVPEDLRAVVMASSDGGVFLSTKNEVYGRVNAIEVRWLHDDHVVEITVADEGHVLGTASHDLPDRLPGGMVIETFSGQKVPEPKIVGWQSYDGQLIAIVEGQIGNGQPSRAAINRLGEQFVIGRNGTIEGVQEDSRLWAVVARNRSQDLAEIQFVGRVTIMSGLFLWLLATATTWRVAKSALRPVKDIIEQAERIDPRKLEQRLPVRSADDELSRISRTVNRMLDRIQEGCQRERQFTGDASHEIRIPLAKMIAEIDLALSRKRGQAEYEDALVRMRRYAEGMQRLSKSLLMLARLDGGLESIEIRPFDVASLAMDVLKSLPQDSTERIRLELGQSSSPMQALGHRELIGVLLGNLIDNALRYSLPQSPVYLRISNHSEDIRIEVEDEGPGIPEEQIERVFDRFYCRERSRSKQSGGIGLGLSIVKAIADVHGMTVTLKRGTKHGTLAIFTLSSFSHAEGCEKQIS